MASQKRGRTRSNLHVSGICMRERERALLCHYNNSRGKPQKCARVGSVLDGSQADKCAPTTSRHDRCAIRAQVVADRSDLQRLQAQKQQQQQQQQWRPHASLDRSKGESEKLPLRGFILQRPKRKMRVQSRPPACDDSGGSHLARRNFRNLQQLGGVVTYTSATYFVV